jgi:hypothetical protein
LALSWVEAAEEFPPDDLELSCELQRRHDEWLAALAADERTAEAKASDQLGEGWLKMGSPHDARDPADLDGSGFCQDVV